MKKIIFLILLTILLPNYSSDSQEDNKKGSSTPRTEILENWYKNFVSKMTKVQRELLFQFLASLDDKEIEEINWEAKKKENSNLSDDAIEAAKEGIKHCKSSNNLLTINRLCLYLTLMSTRSNS